MKDYADRMEDIVHTKEMAEALVTNTPGGFVVFIVKEGNIIPVYQSDGLRKMLGYEEEEEFPELFRYNVNYFVHPDDMQAVLEQEKISIEQHKNFSMEYRAICKDHSEKWMHTSSQIVQKQGYDVHYASYIDLTDMKQAEWNFREKSDKDSLTHLWKRQPGIAEMEKILKQNSHHRHAVLFMDLDDFKKMNDSEGHEIGNHILTCFADVLKELLGRSIVLRYGGDEFVALLENITSRMSLEEKIEQIQREFMDKAEKMHYSATCSVGVAYTNEGLSAEEVINHADEAMYDAKRCGKNAYVFYKYDEDDMESQNQGLYLYDNIACSKWMERISSGLVDQVGIIAIEVAPEQNMSSENTAVLVKRMLNNLFRKDDIFQTAEYTFLILAANITQERFSQKFYDLEHYFKTSKYSGIYVGASWCSNGEELKSYISFAKSQLEAYKQNNQDVTIIVDQELTVIDSKRQIFIFNRNADLKQQLTELLQDEYDLTFAETIEDITKDTRTYDLFLSTVEADKTENNEYYQISNRFDFAEIPAIMMISSMSETGKETFLRHGINAIIEEPFEFKQIKYMIDNLMKLSPNQHKIHSASFDELTFLPNSSYFYELCSKVLEEHKRQSYCLIAFDVEKFKTFNDANGFEAGNQFIVEISEILSEAFKGAILSRMGDDHFAVFSSISEHKAAIQKVHERVYYNSYGFPMNIKAGIYHIRKGDTIKLAYDRAKLSCDNVKNEYDVVYGVYDDTLRDQLLMEKYINDHLNQAITYEYLKVYYQPVIRAVSQKICGFESLIRWEDPEKGFLYPSVFIPTLEKNRTINRLDTFMIQQVCKDIAQFRETHKTPIPVSINLSQLDFELCDIYGVVCNATAKYDIPHSMIHIEITESAMNSQNDCMIETVEKFRQAGFEIWMDDFGSEYSSLNALKNFKLDILKLDMEFLRNFDKNENARKIVSAVIDMAKEIGCRTVAEGVERAYEFEFLKKIGCDKIQGYYFYKPMPYTQAAQLDDFESMEEKAYYDELGRINYQSNNLLTERDDSMFATLNAPLAIFEIENDTFQVLFASQGYFETLATLNLYELDEVEKIINDHSNELYQILREPVYRTLASGKFEKVDFLFGKIPCRTVCKKIVKSAKKGAFYVLLYNTEYMDNLHRNHADINSYMNFLCSIYDRIDFIDYENDHIKNVYLNSQHLGNLFAGTTVLECVADFAKNNIVEQDREDFLKFYDKNNVLTRLSAADQQHIGDIFRVVDLKNGVRWQLFMLVKIRQNDTINYLSCACDFDSAKNAKITSYHDKYMMQMLDFISDGAVIFKYQDGMGYAQYANQTLLNMLHAKESDIIGCNYEYLTEMVEETDREIVVRALEDLKNTNQCHMVCRVRDFQYHQTIWLMANGKRLQMGEDDIAYITFSNISQQQSKIEREKLFAHCLQMISSQSQFAENFNDILESVRGYYDADRAYVFEFDWKNSHMSNTYERVKAGITEEKDNLQNIPISTVIPWLSAFNKGKAMFIDSVEKLREIPSRKREYEILAAQDIQNLMAAPIVYDHQLYGYMGVDNPRINRTDHEYLVNLTLFISQEFYDRKMKQKLYKLSYYDSLTGIRNRNAYNMRWKTPEECVQTNTGIAFIDINGLKHVNDEQGHLSGDELIRNTANIMKRHFCEDMLYRMSGDEFVIVLENIAQDEFTACMEALRQDFDAHQHIASMGYSWTARVTDVEKLVQEAEKGMYDAKNLYYMSDPSRDRRRRSDE